MVYGLRWYMAQAQSKLEIYEVENKIKSFKNRPVVLLGTYNSVGNIA
jgi:hypothetical protein